MSARLWQEVDGEPMLSPRGMAILFGVDEAEVLAIARNEKPDGTGAGTIPQEWIRNGVRRRKAAQAALGYDAGMLQVLQYYQRTEARQ